MPYLLIENFEAGLDTRKTAFTAPPGSLRELVNGHITRGKEIERRKAFATIATLPAGTFGLHAVQDELITFGSGTEPVDMPATVRYQQLVSPNGGNMVRLYDAENFAGQVYAVAEFDDGSFHHFYGGVLVDEWEILAADIGDEVSVASSLGQQLAESDVVEVLLVRNRLVLTAEVPGVAFTVTPSGDMTVTLEQAAVAAVPEVAATASFEITAGSPGITFNTIAEVTIDGQDLIGAFVNFDTDIATTASNVATAINTGLTAYTAAAVGGVVTITAPAGLGASANGRVLGVVPAGDVTVASVTNMAGGAVPVAAVPQISSVVVDVYQADTTYQLTVDGTDYMVRGESSAMPLAFRVVKQKVYAVTGSLLFFSGFSGANADADPTRWINDDGTAAFATAQFTIVAGTDGVPNTVDSVTVDGTELLNAASVAFTNNNNADTAAAIATDINAGASGYTAAASDNTVIITAPATGPAPNGDELVVSTTGTVVAADLRDMSGGVDAAENPVVIGAGFIDISTQMGNAEILTGVGVYQDKVAVFSQRSVQLWTVDPDPAQNIIYQVLNNIGAVAPLSIVEYGDLDVFFLSESGVRSLRARDSSNLASANDVGVTIDAELTDYMNTISQEQVRNARAVVEPIDSRYLLAVGPRVYVFSNFPGSRVSAWSTYELEGTVTDWAISNGKLHARVGDEVKRYGGLSGVEYDTSKTSVVLPFLDASNPGMRKKIKSIDAGLLGTWDVSMATEPDDPDEWEDVASLTRSTYGSEMKIGAIGRSTHVAMRMSTSKAERAIIGNFIIHFDEIKAE